MANYPDVIYIPRVMTNRLGVTYDSLKTKVVYAEDFNLDRDEIVAIQNELGTNPKGTYASVSERLDAAGMNYDTIIVDTSVPSVITVTKQLLGVTVDVKTINII